MDAEGIITTVAGNGENDYSGDDGQATGAKINKPNNISVDASGNIYIADTGNHRIRKVDADGIITTVAGTGSRGYSGEGTAINEKINKPAGVSVDASGNIYIADTGNHRIRKVDADGIITTVAGTGSRGYSGEGTAINEKINKPAGVSVDASGNIYIADTGNHRIRKVDAGGIITTVAGTGSGGYSGEGTAINEKINKPGGVSVDESGNIYIADTENHRIRKVDAGGIITTVAGNGSTTYCCDGGPATSASINEPAGVSVDADGNIYIADTENHRIRKVDADGIISTVAGTGSAGYSGEGTAINKKIKEPKGVSVDADGNIYIADTENHRIRKVDADGIITTVAGTGSRGYSGDDGQATEGKINKPAGVSVDESGNIYIADTENHRIRKVDAGGIITTVAGTGSRGYSGEGTAINKKINKPGGVWAKSSSFKIF